MTMAEMRRVECGEDYFIIYELNRRNVKNVNMRVRQDGTVSVSADRHVPLSFLDDFVRSRKDFIEKARTKNSERHRRLPNDMVGYKDGAVIRIFGQDCLITAAGGSMEGVECVECVECVESVKCAGRIQDQSGRKLVVTVKDTGDAGRMERLIYAYLRQLQTDTFREICHAVYPLFAGRGISYPRVKIKTMDSRWGSCIPSKGIIALNSRLIEYPRECIEYVVLHEFCHFIYPDHSKNFYALVASFMPDWKARKKAMEE